MVVLEIFVAPALSIIYLNVDNGYFIGVCIILVICPCVIFPVCFSHHIFFKHWIFDVFLDLEEAFSRPKERFLTILLFSASELIIKTRPLFGSHLIEHSGVATGPACPAQQD